MRKTSFNDNWTYRGKAVTLPHDAMIHEERDPDADSGSAGAFFPDGKYVYEKTFARPETGHAILQFEGVYKNSRVYVNDKLAGGAAYGYIPFFVELDDYLVDGKNSIRVECEVVHPDSRWYSGAGIYRPVWLWEGPKDSIEPESVRISTVSYDPAVIHVDSDADVKVSIQADDGYTFSGEGRSFDIPMPGAKLWSDESPYLYTASVTNESDSEEIEFGIRKVEWSPEGLFINGKSTLLRGGCIHHDNGVLGAATYDESEYRRVSKMKEAGFNAIRSSHNPASRAMLEACDRLGIYVMDETWDMWFHHKSKNDYAGEWRDNYLADIDAMVSRDYNHPSVIMYSIGNEVSEPAKPEGIDKTREMAEHIRSIDPGRAVTGGFNLMIISSASKGKGIYDESGEGRKGQDNEKKMQGMNSTMFNLVTSMIGPGMNKSANSKKADKVTSPSLDLLDIAGYNYGSGRYPLEKKAHPDRVLLGSETFPQTISKNWKMVEEYPYLVGDFMWTAWDYLGEVGIGAWAYTADGKGFDKPYPWLLADTGAMDILGNPNGELFWASAVWGQGTFMAVQPVNHDRRPARAAWRGTNAIPSWSWTGCGGRNATVEVYTDGARAELFVNGEPAGKARVKDHRAIFRTKYVPGKLEAAVYDKSGREIARTELNSAGKASVTVLPEKNEVRPGEIVYVPVVICDRDGIVESNADVNVNVKVENGELLGFGSANPRTEERFDTGRYTTYYGRALAVIRAGSSGTVKITANDASAEIEII